MTRLLLLFLGAPVLATAAVLIYAADWPAVAQARLVLILSVAAILGTALTRDLATGKHSLHLPYRFSADRVLNKAFALAAGWLLIACGAAISAQVNVVPAIVFLDDFVVAAPIFFLLLPVFVVLTECVRGVQSDTNASFGAFLRRRGAWQPSEHKKFVLGWLIKAFFLPLMYGYFLLSGGQLLKSGLPDLSNWAAWFVNFGLCIDVMVATIGYFAAGQLFRSEIRSVDESWTGWIVCLMCYPPFFQHVSQVIGQRDSLIWSDWLNPEQPLYWIWGIMVVATWSTYWLSHLCFGLNFSNLTYRGLVDRGPYRFVKHPAYLSKNLYWWLYAVPLFGAASTSDMVANVAGLSALNLIYYLRARTEERHLMKFPEYAEYARRIESRSLKSRLQRWYAQPSDI